MLKRRREEEAKELGLVLFEQISQISSVHKHQRELALVKLDVLKEQKKVFFYYFFFVCFIYFFFFFRPLKGKLIFKREIETCLSKLLILSGCQLKSK